MLYFWLIIGFLWIFDGFITGYNWILRVYNWIFMDLMVFLYHFSNQTWFNIILIHQKESKRPLFGYKDRKGCDHCPAHCEFWMWLHRWVWLFVLRQASG